MTTSPDHWLLHRMNHRLSALVVAVLLLAGCAGAGAAVYPPT